MSWDGTGSDIIAALTEELFGTTAISDCGSLVALGSIMGKPLGAAN